MKVNLDLGLETVNPVSLISVSGVFVGSFKGVSRKFQGCFKEVLRVLTESF